MIWNLLRSWNYIVFYVPDDSFECSQIYSRATKRKRMLVAGVIVFWVGVFAAATLVSAAVG